ncbi:MAG: isocitrate lyase/phosphoenolpyruvate mutase family protein [Pseudomonadota bacterium]
MTDPATTFRALHQTEALFVMPNPWDAGTAQILKALGFKALATASAAQAFSLGLEDESDQVGKDAAIDHAKMMTEAVDLPINGDFQDGFGAQPEDVAETITHSIAAGLAGCSIEDLRGDGLYDRSLAIDRIKAAVEARNATGSNFVLTARCESYIADHPKPLEEAIDRLAAMAEAGADVVYACGMYERDHIAALVREVPVPVNVLGGTGPKPLSVRELEDLGVRRVSLGPRLLQAALSGFLQASKEVAGQGTFNFMSTAPSLDSVSDLIRR